MEGVEVVQALAGRGEHDRLAGDLGDGQRCTTAGVAVQLGQHHAVEADPFGEGIGGVDCVLTDHGIDHEQDLGGLHRVTNVGGLLHQFGVDTQPASGVDDHHVEQLGGGMLDRCPRHRDRVTHTAAGLGSEDLHTGAFTDHLQLGDRVRALQVSGDEQR